MAKDSNKKNRVIEWVIVLFVVITAGLLIMEVFINLMDVL